MFAKPALSSAPGPCAPNPAGIAPKGRFPCEARCFCGVGDTVWTGERSGVVTVRCARSGNVISHFDLGSGHVFATAMVAVDTEMWIGTTDGRICVVDIASSQVIAELVSPETESACEVYGFAVSGRTIFVATANCRVLEWDIKRKLYVRGFLHAKQVRGVAASPYSLFSGDDTGAVFRWDLQSGERVDSANDSPHAVTCLLMEPTTRHVWAGRTDGTVDVYRQDPLVRVHSINDARSRITSLLAVGGKVWGAGMDRSVFVWHGAAYTLLGHTKNHSSFIFALGKLYTMETARIWSLSNDKTVCVYDGEGFFTPVSPHNASEDELNSAHALVQTLRHDIAVLEKRLAASVDRAVVKEGEAEKWRTENQQMLVRVHAMEHTVDAKEESLLANASKTHRLLSELEAASRKVSELTLKLSHAEQDKTVLRGDVVRLEEQLSRARAAITEHSSKASLTENERNSLSSDKARMASFLEAKDKENVDLAFQSKALRDELGCKKMEIGKLESEVRLAKARISDLEHERALWEQNKKALTEEKRRLEDTVILRENALRELGAQLALLTNKNSSATALLSDLEAQSQFRLSETKRLEDTYALRSHEYDLLRTEKQQVFDALQHEKALLYDARSNETKLRLQNDELRRQLESEKMAVKLLQDQYTIFQFVISSRGELVQAIWDLHGKLEAATRATKSMDVAVKHWDPTKEKLALKHEWRTNVCSKAAASLTAVSDVATKAGYIISNFFSEYEKLHLGVSASKFPPDAARPVIVGDELLSKLRDVNLTKQYSVGKPAAAALSASYRSAASTILPPPFDPSLGPHHIAPISRTTVKPATPSPSHSIAVPL